MDKTIHEIREEVNKASWKTPNSELEQLKSDISKKMDDKRISNHTYLVLSTWYDIIHHLTFKETANPDYIIKNEFGEKVGSIKINTVLDTRTIVDVWFYHMKIGCMDISDAIKKCNELSLSIERELKNENNNNKD